MSMTRAEYDSAIRYLNSLHRCSTQGHWQPLHCHKCDRTLRCRVCHPDATPSRSIRDPDDPTGLIHICEPCQKGPHP